MGSVGLTNCKSCQYELAMEGFMSYLNESAEICKTCGKKFTWELHGIGYPGGRDREDIICPYCGAKN